jgi:hypothetical protein
MKYLKSLVRPGEMFVFGALVVMLLYTLMPSWLVVIFIFIIGTGINYLEEEIQKRFP